MYTIPCYNTTITQFRVVGPDHPIAAVVGEDTVLPCYLSPSTSAENMEVRWFRSEFTSPVHLYLDGMDQFEQQMPDYQGRTELWKDGILDGNVALRIVNIRPSDEGQYRCFFRSGDFYEEAVLELKVEASGSAPQISVEGYQDGGIQMVCHLAGWYPEPEVLWRDLRGQPLSSFTQTKSKDQRGLFEIKSSIIITENSNKNLSCSMRKMHLNLEKEPSTLYISGQKPSKLNTDILNAQFTVVGPDHPITATVGKDIVLSCHLSPSTSAVNMEVRWYRSEFNSPVYLHRHGKDQYEQQMTDYQGRTELWKAALMDGDVFLTIVNIRPSDEGQYHCSVQEGDFYEEAVLELKVEASGSAPQISVEGHQDGGIRMVCHLAGWYPEPEVLWRDLRGQPLSSFTQTKSKDEHGLFEIKSSIIIRENSNKNIYCSIRKMNLNLEKEPSTLYISGQIPPKLNIAILNGGRTGKEIKYELFVSDSFFPRVSPWTVTWSVTLVILLVFISLTLFQFKLRGKAPMGKYSVTRMRFSPEIPPHNPF
uniref:Ig-like domain-containing protein n=1 Tax=Pelusios castaneus TaxID=367368 RepID=A0A8C8VLE9_9SAUR